MLLTLQIRSTSNFVPHVEQRGLLGGRGFPHGQRQAKGISTNSADSIVFLEEASNEEGGGKEGEVEAAEDVQEEGTELANGAEEGKVEAADDEEEEEAEGAEGEVVEDLEAHGAGEDDCSKETVVVSNWLQA